MQAVKLFGQFELLVSVGADHVRDAADQGVRVNLAEVLAIVSRGPGRTHVAKVKLGSSQSGRDHFLD